MPINAGACYKWSGRAWGMEVWAVRIFFVLGLVAVLLLAATAVVAISVSLSSYPSCDHQTVREFPSPNRNRAAIVFLTNCGATTPFVSSVAVRNAGETLNIETDHFF